MLREPTLKWQKPSLEAHKEFCLCVGWQRKALLKISFLIKCLISAKLGLVCATYLVICHIVGLIFINLFISKHVTCPWAFLCYIFKPTWFKLCAFKTSQNLTYNANPYSLNYCSTSSHGTSEVVELLLLKRHSSYGLSVLLLQSPPWRGYNLGCVNLIELKLGTPTVSPYRELSYE